MIRVLFEYLFDLFITDRLLLFFVSILVCTIFPGFLIYKNTFDSNDDNDKLSKIVIYSFYFGVFLNIAIYGILLPFKATKCCLIVNLIVIIVLVILTVLKKTKLSIIYDYKWYFYFSISAILFFCFVNLWMNYPARNIVIHADHVFHFKNINAFSHGLIEEFSVKGIEFRYHFFNDLLFSYYKILSGCQSYYMVIIGTVFLIPVLITNTVYYVLEKYVTKNKLLILLLANIILLHPSISYSAQNNVGQHFLGNVNAVGLALPLAMLLLDYIISNRNYITLKYYLIISISVLNLNGFKSPFAIVILFSLIVVEVIDSLYRKILHKKNYVFLLIITLLYIIQFKTVITSLKYPSGVTYISFTNFGKIVNLDSVLKNVRTILDNFLPSLISSIVMFPMWLIIAYGFILVLLILILIKLKCRIFEYKNLLLFFTFLTGMGVCYLVHFDGTSELYFAHVSDVAILLFILVNSDIINFENVNGFVKYVLVGFCFISSFFFCGDISKEISNGRHHIKNIIINKGHFNNDKLQYIEGGLKPQDVPYTSELFITQDEVDGLDFLRKNSKEGDIIATNRHFLTSNVDSGDAGYFYDTGYSDRQAYIEGWAYSYRSLFKEYEERARQNDLLFTKVLTEKEKYDFCKEKGIDYLVCHTKHLNNYVTPSEYFDMFYENEDITILKRKD